MDNTHTSSMSAPTNAAPRLRGVALGCVLGALMLTLFLEALDQTVVGTALPRIVASLHGYNLYIWAVTAYTLASSTLIPIVGKLSDQFGRKWFLIGGTVIFLLGSALCGMSQTMEQLIAFRALQGLGAGMGIALAMTATGDIFPPAERARWAGLFGAVYGLSSVVGPILGGWLTDHGPLIGTLINDDTRWRWVFYINIPLGLIALSALLVYLPENLSVRSSRYSGWAAVRHIDWWGGLLAAAATISLLLGLTWGGNQVYAWNSPQVVGTLVATGVLYALFIVVEGLAVEPVLPLDLFRNRNFTLASILSLLQLMVLIGLVVYLPLYLQGVLGESASNSGAVITPLTFAAVVGSMVGAFALVTLKSMRNISVLGAILLTIGVALLLRFSATTGTAETLIVMVIIGLGLGPFFVVPPLAAQNALPSSRLGVGTASVRYMGQLGSVLGVAIIGTVVNTTLSTDLSPRLSHIAGIASLPAPVVTQATNPQVLVNSALRNGLIQGVLQYVPPQFQASTLHALNQIFAALQQSLMVGLNHGFIVLLGLSVATIICTALLKDAPLRETNDDPAAGTDVSEDQREAALPFA